MDALETVSTEELLDELFSRHEYCIFSGVSNGFCTGERNTNRKYKGDTVTTAGLAMFLYSFIYSQWVNEQHAIENRQE